MKGGIFIKFKKVLIIAIVSLLLIPFCMIFSSIIHFQLSKMKFVLDISTIIKSIISNRNHLLLFIFTQAFAEFFILYLFLFSKKNGLSTETNAITKNIRTPKIYGNGQHGTARWSTKKELLKKATINTLKTTKDGKIKKVNFSKGGLVVGLEKKKNENKIICISEDYHSLIIGSTGAGKTRRLLLPSAMNYALASSYGKNKNSLVLTDPKGELFQYLSPYFKSLGYKIITIDFKNPLKSTRYNFLSPVIEAFKNGDIRKAEEYCWDITQALVGNEETKMEKIWKDGEMSIIAGTIMTIVAENMDHPEFQNLTNVYTFISEMCRSENGKMPINYFIENLPPEHPAINIFGIARIAPEKTRSSFFTSALTTLRLFTSQTVYDMTCQSDFNLKDIGTDKYFVDIILPDERLTYYSLASLYTKQQYNALVEYADSHGGTLKTRVDFLCDEFRELCTNRTAYGSMLTVARSRNIFFHFFLQRIFTISQSVWKRNGRFNKR